MNKNTKKPEEKRVNIESGSNLNGDSRLRQLEEALRGFSDFRFNTITRFPEIKAKNDKWKRITDYKLNSIVRHLKRKGIVHASKNKVGDLLESDFAEKINPVQQYFEELPKPTADHIEQLASTVTLFTDPATEPFLNALFRKCLTKWLVGAVANVFIEDRCANQLCFILAGKQGTFKSSWISNLCPPALSDYYVEGSLDPDNKDSMLATASNFIFNLDDYFAGITSRKINEFKGLLTKNTIKVRRSYARYAEELPKICSFIASSNEAQFLHDPTGNRRFLPFEVERIDIQQATQINIDEVWAQAYQLFREDYRYWMTKEEQEELSEYNQQFEVQSNEYEVLVTYMCPPNDGESPEAELTNAEIQEYLQNKISVKLSTKKLGEALRKANFPRKQKQRNGIRSWVYEIVYADEADIFVGRQPTPPGSSQNSTKKPDF